MRDPCPKVIHKYAIDTSGYDPIVFLQVPHEIDLSRLYWKVAQVVEQLVENMELEIQRSYEIDVQPLRVGDTLNL